MGGIYKNGRNLQKIDGISETVLENSEKVHGRKSAGKGRNSAGNGRNYPELQSQQKDVSQVQWTEKNINRRNFLQNLSGQKFVSIEVPGIVRYI